MSYLVNPYRFVPSLTVENFQVSLASGFTTSSTGSFEEVTGTSVTKPTITGGKCLMVVNCSMQNDTDGILQLAIKDDTTIVQYIFEDRGINADTTISGGDTSDTDGQDYTLWVKADSGTSTVQPTAGTRATKINGIGIG